jgi:hypothetical protein
MAYQDFGFGDPKEELTIRLLYRRVYETPDGRRVLAHVLTELGFFDTDVKDEREMGRQDYARRLLWMLGITDHENINRVIDSFLKLPVITRDIRGKPDEGKEEKE